MKRKLISFLLILATFLGAGFASADTLNEGDMDRVANLAVETVVPEKVTVKVVMSGGSFKIGDQTYQDQTTIELPYASDLAVKPVGAQLTKADLDFATVTPAYHLEASLLQVTKIRTDGTVTLTFEKVPTQVTKQGLSGLLPKMSDTERVWISLVGLGLVVSLVIFARKRRRSNRYKL